MWVASRDYENELCLINLDFINHICLDLESFSILGYRLAYLDDDDDITYILFTSQTQNLEEVYAMFDKIKKGLPIIPC
jgi:regulatory protein YycH of two-component signal transduction system YycFG